MDGDSVDGHSVDVVVIGAGPVGENVAARAVRSGLSAVVIENELLGGECSYWACMPSKALLRPGSVLAAARRVPGARQAVTGTLDVDAVLAWRDTITSGWDDAGQVAWAEGADIGVVRGHGRLAGERQVAVTTPGGDTVTWRARRAVVVCTGSVPVTPPVPGLHDHGFWGSREATAAKAVPQRLVVLGGGVVGCELAQAFARFGATVTVLARGGLLGRMEDRAGELVAAGLAADGVDIRAAGATAVDRAPDGTVTVTLDDGTTVVGDELLVATGRRPATADVGAESVGLEPGAPMAVDAGGRVVGVDGDWLWAAGDVTGDAPLTHMGKYAARAVGDAIGALAVGRPSASDPSPWSPLASTALRRAVTQVVFTDPEVASVGLTLAEAGTAGLDVRAVDVELAVAGTTVHGEGYTGWARMVVDERRRTLVGVTFVGPDVAELLHSATVAVVGEVPLDRLWHAVPAYPTISEVWLRLLEAYGL